MVLPSRNSRSLSRPSSCNRLYSRGAGQKQLDFELVEPLDAQQAARGEPRCWTTTARLQGRGGREAKVGPRRRLQNSRESSNRISHCAVGAGPAQRARGAIMRYPKGLVSLPGRRRQGECARMLMIKSETLQDLDPQETQEWLEALDGMIEEYGPERVNFIIDQLIARARGKRRGPASEGHHSLRQYDSDRWTSCPIRATATSSGGSRASSAGTPWRWWCGRISTTTESAGISRPISRLRRWPRSAITTSSAAPIDGHAGDFIYFQGHASPGMYSRAYVEGRLADQHLQNFRHELREHPGLSSYPHPWLMPDFWQFPTVSMGLGPINSIYHARFMRYMENRGLIEPTDRKIWAFVGDGESDEPETLGALTLASREKARQLGLGGELQLAAPGRPGARQRQDHPGARRVVPRPPAGT